MKCIFYSYTGIVSSVEYPHFPPFICYTWKITGNSTTIAHNLETWPLVVSKTSHLSLLSTHDYILELKGTSGKMEVSHILSHLLLSLLLTLWKKFQFDCFMVTWSSLRKQKVGSPSCKGESFSHFNNCVF